MRRADVAVWLCHSMDFSAVSWRGRCGARPNLSPTETRLIRSLENEGLYQTGGIRSSDAPSDMEMITDKDSVRNVADIQIQVVCFEANHPRLKRSNPRPKR